MALKKPSQFFNKEVKNTELLNVEVDDNFCEELAKVENLSEQVSQLQKELSQKIVKNDLESMILSQINSMKENFEILKFDLRKSNQENIGDISKRIFELTDIVNNLIQIEIPKYKNKITKNEIFVGEQIQKFENNLTENSILVSQKIDTKFSNIVEVLDNNIQHFNEKIEETSIEVKKNSETYHSLSKILETKILKENQKFEEYSDSIEILSKSFEELSEILKEELSISSQLVEEKFDDYKNKIENEQINLKNSVDKVLKDHKNELREHQVNFKNSVNELLENQNKQILDVKSEVVINEQHIKNVDKYLQEYHQDLVQVKEEVFSEIGSLPIGNLQENIERLEKKIDFIKETYSQIEPEVIIKEVIQESNFAEPSETKNSDPLTPLNQNFVTLDQLQQHYRLFINRIQQQLSTLGGGGETRLKYLDDIVGIATNPSAYDGKYLKYNHSIGKFEFETVSSGIGSQSIDDVLKTGNVSNLGMSVGVVTATQFDGYLVGSATYAETSGIATYATSSGIATYAATSGIATYATSSGIATYAATSGIATALQNSRTFEITGDIIALPVSFDGTGNVSFAATIQPNSVALGTDTTGDYVQSVSGTANEITVTGGTGEGSTPVISISPNPLLPGNVTIANDLQVNNNLNVTGNITIGGTSAYIISNDLRVKDADIVLGYTTSITGNDVSNDTTANHGGIAIASTEGTPLVQLYNVAIGETNPATYKKIMWFKSGAFAGLNTDAWLINYAVGIGSTQFPSGTRLAAGSVQFTENDLAVVRNINASGISTLGTVRVYSGIVTATTGIVTYYGDGRNLTITNPGVGIATAGGTVGTGVTLLDFRGSGISTVTTSSGIATINITGSSSDISPVMMSMIF